MKFKLLLATMAAMACVAGAAQSAGAAATFNVTADNNAAGNATALTLTTSLSGLGNATKEYGANLQLPSSIGIDYPAYGSGTQRCPAANITTVNGTYGQYRAFTNANCPAEALIGTATLGSQSGKIYWVDSSPTPHFGVWFDTGVSPAYGRVLNLNWNGSAPLLTIRGLPNTSTSGLSLTFNNPSRPTLPGKVWRWVQPGDSNCVASNSFTGSVLTYPLIGTTLTTTTMTPKTITLRGCGMSYSLTTDSAVANAYTTLDVKTNLTGTGNDARQYGASFHTPGNIAFSYPGYGNNSQYCSPTSVNGGTIGTLTQKSRKFDPVGNCPEEAKIGTATLGSMTGSIYVVGISPLPSWGLYFDQGTANPFGMEITRTWDSAGAETMTTYGLPNIVSSGLRLTFYNPSRPSGLPTKPWVNRDYQCNLGNTTADVFTYPASGTTADSVAGIIGPFHNVTGC